jgi:hypothetical protein
VNGWSLGEPKLNKENKALVRAWIATINTRDKKKELGHKEEKKKIALA